MRWFTLAVMSLILGGVTSSMILYELEMGTAFWLGIVQCICFAIISWIISEEK